MVPSIGSPEALSVLAEQVAVFGYVGQSDCRARPDRDRGSIFRHDRLAIAEVTVEILRAAEIFGEIHRRIEPAAFAFGDGEMFRTDAEGQLVS
jgi:hypothetical protein